MNHGLHRSLQGRVCRQLLHGLTIRRVARIAFRVNPQRLQLGNRIFQLGQLSDFFRQFLRNVLQLILNDAQVTDKLLHGPRVILHIGPFTVTHLDVHDLHPLHVGVAGDDSQLEHIDAGHAAVLRGDLQTDLALVISACAGVILDGQKDQAAVFAGGLAHILCAVGHGDSGGAVAQHVLYGVEVSGDIVRAVFGAGEVVGADGEAIGVNVAALLVLCHRQRLCTVRRRSLLFGQG